MWTAKQTEAHRKVAIILTKIMKDTFQYIETNRRSVTEFEVSEFILGQHRLNGIISCRTLPCPIVAFGNNTSILHYFPEKKTARKLKRNMPILIDMWGKLGSGKMPFADITWFGYYGTSIPKKTQQAFNLVVASRDASIRFVRKALETGHLPTGRKVDAVFQEILHKSKLGMCFYHQLGHPLGTYSPHGFGSWLTESNYYPLLAGCAYTIEPGVYFTNRFGIRSEMDLLITPQLNLEITTPLQRKIIHIR
ncbi:M24 family metallopeptidase [Patescibacteria group bacterium]